MYPNSNHLARSTMSNQAVSKKYIRLIGRDCGVTRMTKDVNDFIQEQVHDYIKYLINEGKIFMEYRGKITLTRADCESAAKRTL